MNWVRFWVTRAWLRWMSRQNDCDGCFLCKNFLGGVMNNRVMHTRFRTERTKEISLNIENSKHKLKFTVNIPFVWTATAWKQCFCDTMDLTKMYHYCLGVSVGGLIGSHWFYLLGSLMMLTHDFEFLSFFVFDVVLGTQCAMIHHLKGVFGSTFSHYNLIKLLI